MLAVLGVLSSLMDRPQATAWLHYEATVLHDVDDSDGHPRARDLMLFGVKLHGTIGKRVLQYHAGFDLAAGATLGGGGFAYDVALFPVGIATKLPGSSVIALGAGVGAMGATGSIDDAATFPVELTGEFGNGAARLLFRARATWVAGGLRGGAPSASFADELEGMIGLRIGSHDKDYGFSYGEGYFAGVGYREFEGARFVGLVVGYSISGGTSARHATSTRDE
ncbi:MAG TPA: hypothetical protein VGM88_27710 [Kofleriaceae bacterium]